MLPPEVTGAADEDGDRDRTGTRAPGARQVEISSRGTGPTHATELGHAFGVQPGRHQLEEAGGRHLTDPIDQRATDLLPLLLGGRDGLSLRVGGLLRGVPGEQLDGVAEQAKARCLSLPATLGGVAANRSGERGGEGLRVPLEPASLHELVRRLRQRGRLPVPALLEDGGQRVGQLLPEQVLVSGRALPVTVDGTGGLATAAAPRRTAALVLLGGAAVVIAPATAAAPTTLPSLALAAAIVVVALLALVVALLLLHLALDLREDGLVVPLLLREDVGPRVRGARGGGGALLVAAVVVLGLPLLLRGELVLVTGLGLRGLEHLGVELAQPEDAGLDLDDGGLAVVLSHHGREAGAHGGLRGLAHVREQISLDRDLRDLLVVKGLTDEPQHLRGGFRERHLSNPRTLMVPFGRSRDHAGPGATSAYCGAGPARKASLPASRCHESVWLRAKGPSRWSGPTP